MTGTLRQRCAHDAPVFIDGMCPLCADAELSRLRKDILALLDRLASAEAVLAAAVAWRARRPTRWPPGWAGPTGTLIAAVDAMNGRTET